MEADVQWNLPPPVWVEAWWVETVLCVSDPRLAPTDASRRSVSASFPTHARREAGPEASKKLSPTCPPPIGRLLRMSDKQQQLQHPPIMKQLFAFSSAPTLRGLSLFAFHLGAAVSLSIPAFAEGLETTPVPPPPLLLTAPNATPVPTASPQNLTALAWDSEFKELSTKLGDATAQFTFWFTNTSSEELTIKSVRASCGCTTAKVPALPWKIIPGASNPIEVSVDLRGKQGAISKALTVDTTAGTKSLTFKINIPNAPAAAEAAQPSAPSAQLDPDRARGMDLALKDRQVVFKDAQCATCHADPAQGQTDGEQLYSAVCANCHDSPQRAELVTNLRTLKNETDVDYWKQWISNGRDGSMMPAFSRSEGGPLNEQQIDALAAYCALVFKPASAAPASAKRGRS